MDMGQYFFPKTITTLINIYQNETSCHTFTMYFDQIYTVLSSAPSPQASQPRPTSICVDKVNE